MKIAIVMTVFNRREKTLSCLESLTMQKNMPYYDVYLCDDGSTDGTEEAVKQKFDNVIIIKGNGGLFWSRGMAKAMKAAISGKYDYYLMINDDVLFFDNMWEVMYRAIQGKTLVGVTGCTKSKESGLVTYSGATFYNPNGTRFVGNKLEPIKGKVQECDVANWNCFLLPRSVIERVGIIDSVYEHSFGDFDYSLRMRKEGINIYITDEYVGYCENNSITNTYMDKTLNRIVRIKKILSPNGLPMKSWFVFSFRHYGKNAFRNFIVPYIKFILSLIRQCSN